MRAIDNWQSRRAARQAQMISAARRRHLESMLESPDYLPSSPHGPQGAQAQHAAGSGRALLGVFYSILGSLAVVVGLGNGGPFFGGTWMPVPLLIGASVAVLAFTESRRVLRDCSSVSKLGALFVCVLIASSFAMGIKGQVTVGDRPQWRYSTTAQANDLALGIRDDLYVLQENQSLFAYPPEQARSMLAYYQSAALQAEEIATRWNPATAPKDLPLPGFVGVLEKVNSAADLQRQALAAYSDYLRSPDARLAEQVQVLAAGAEQNYLLAAQELASIVKPLGIVLTPGTA